MLLHRTPPLAATLSLCTLYVVVDVVFFSCCLLFFVHFAWNARIASLCTRRARVKDFKKLLLRIRCRGKLQKLNYTNYIIHSQHTQRLVFCVYTFVHMPGIYASAFSVFFFHIPSAKSVDFKKKTTKIEVQVSHDTIDFSHFAKPTDF